MGKIRNFSDGVQNISDQGLCSAFTTVKAFCKEVFRKSEHGLKLGNYHLTFFVEH